MKWVIIGITSDDRWVYYKEYSLKKGYPIWTIDIEGARHFPQENHVRFVLKTLKKKHPTFKMWYIEYTPSEVEYPDYDRAMKGVV